MMKPLPHRPAYRRGDGDKTTRRPIPPLASGDIRIIPLGGVEEIGKNSVSPWIAPAKIAKKKFTVKI